ncbi:hypothetical protein J2Z48_003048 [Croceifilum oryzae]|uniref:HD domain-containing protein n=1 Tax=Croceifilum oryzae TaxID=1553429 RepID=A0AAJ1WU95_9BACL|nr:HD domain-containing protein [Croceifilum oryzae]MDQ0418843.1 hypothetical protein [Croceifilum oryzae]
MINQTAQQVTFDDRQLSKYLSPEQNRYHHVLGVVERMRELLEKINIPSEWKPQLVQTAYMHDVGYNEQLNQHNFHPLDGALFAEEIGIPKPIIAGILFHSDAYTSVKHTRPDLIEIYDKKYNLLDEIDHTFIDLITYCDIHTSPVGAKITLEERVLDVIKRYGEGHEVSNMMLLSQPYYQEVERRVEKLFM